MLENKEIKIDNMDFQLQPLRGFKANKLDKKVISLLLPLLEGADGLDSEINIGKALGGLSGALDNLSEKDYETFVVDLLSTVILIPEKEAPTQLDVNSIDVYFQGASLTLYKLMFEVMKYNNFTPFVLASGGGSGMKKTLTFAGLAKNIKG